MTGKQLLNILATSEEARNIVMASLLFAGLVSETEELELDDIIIPQKQSYNFTEIAKEYRQLWVDYLPEHLISKSGILAKIKDRLQKFLLEVNDAFTFEDIMKATKLYLLDCKDKNRFAKAPEYFILDQHEKKCVNSDLYDWCTKTKEEYHDYTQRI